MDPHDAKTAIDTALRRLFGTDLEVDEKVYLSLLVSKTNRKHTQPTPTAIWGGLPLIWPTINSIYERLGFDHAVLKKNLRPQTPRFIDSHSRDATSINWERSLAKIFFDKEKDSNKLHFGQVANLVRERGNLSIGDLFLALLENKFVDVRGRSISSFPMRRFAEGCGLGSKQRLWSETTEALFASATRAVEISLTQDASNGNQQFIIFRMRK